jgi:CBS domain-containing protein
MKIRDVMTENPVCCLPTDTAQKVATIMRDQNVGSLPVVEDADRRRLVGMITDRDLCIGVIADGLDSKSTPIAKYVSVTPVTCREGENLDACEKAMQEHQVRRIPIVDGDDCVIGIVSQADLALRDKPEKVSKTVAEISKPETAGPLAA